MNNSDLKFLRAKLKAGEYDGADIMRAWIAIDELSEQLARASDAFEREQKRADLADVRAEAAQELLNALRSAELMMREHGMTTHGVYAEVCAALKKAVCAG